MNFGIQDDQNIIRIILSAPVPFPFLRTLDFGFWILDLDFGLDLGLTIINRINSGSNSPAELLLETTTLLIWNQLVVVPYLLTKMRFPRAFAGHLNVYVVEPS